MAVITEAKLRAMLAKGIPNPYPLHEGDKLTPAAADFLKGRGISLKPIKSTETPQQDGFPAGDILIPVGVSNRHVHLSPEDVEILFGKGHTLTPMRNLSQPGQYAAKETVTLLGPKGLIQGVRVLGPARGATQVEISRTDGFQLGVHPPVRLSGSHEGTPGLTLIGPHGVVTLSQGVIVAQCHVHMSDAEAGKLGVTQTDRLILRTGGPRPIVFPEVAVRISPNYALDFHIDLDEANAAHLKTGDTIQMVGKNGVMFASGR